MVPQKPRGNACVVVALALLASAMACGAGGEERRLPGLDSEIRHYEGDHQATREGDEEPMPEWLVTALISAAVSLLMVVGAYRLSIRAQKKLFLHKVENDARVELTTALKRYRAWLHTTPAELFQLEIEIHAVESNAQVRELQGAAGSLSHLDRDEWKARLKRTIQTVWDEDRDHWLELLEAYEIVFPETRGLRTDLRHRHEVIAETLNGCARDAYVLDTSSENAPSRMIQALAP